MQTRHKSFLTDVALFSRCSAQRPLANRCRCIDAAIANPLFRSAWNGNVNKWLILEPLKIRRMSVRRSMPVFDSSSACPLEPSAAHLPHSLHKRAWSEIGFICDATPFADQKPWRIWSFKDYCPPPCNTFAGSRETKCNPWPMASCLRTNVLIMGKPLLSLSNNLFRHPLSVWFCFWLDCSLAVPSFLNEDAILYLCFSAATYNNGWTRAF